MKPIERLISVKHDVDVGEVYAFANRHRPDYQFFLSLEMAQEKRRVYDQQKSQWTQVGVHNEYQWTKKSFSRIMKDERTGFFYVSLELADDILVSDLYPRKRVEQIQKYLDQNNWSKKALNTLKKSGYESLEPYYGILPTREGYQIMDYKGTKYGLFPKLDGAVKYRNTLLQKGVIL